MKTDSVTLVAEVEMCPSTLCVYAKQSFALWYEDFMSLTSYLLSQNLHWALKRSSKRSKGINRKKEQQRHVAFGLAENQQKHRGVIKERFSTSNETRQCI